MLYARSKRDSYENFEAECPHCRKWNVFNRVSELDGESWISYREVTCQSPECRQQFAINGDSADAPYAKVFFDAYGQMAAKQYGDAVMSIARAYEMFFEHYLTEELAWKPFMRNMLTAPLSENYAPEDLNVVLKHLHAVIHRWTYQPLRNAFMNIAAAVQIVTLADGDAVIADLPRFSQGVDRKALSRVNNVALREALLALLESRTAALRNEVVHKYGKRPLECEAQLAFEEARRVIWTLAEELDVRFTSV